MKKNEDNKNLKEEFNIIKNDDLKKNSENLESFPWDQSENEKIKFYERTANYILIKNIIINKNTNNNEISATNLIQFLLDVVQLQEQLLI